MFLQVTKTCTCIVKTVKNIQEPRFQKKLVLISKNRIKGKSKCPICLTERTLIHQIKGKYDLESELEIYLQFFTDWCYKRTWRLIAWSVEKKPENLDSKILKTKNSRLIMQSKCTGWGFKKSRFVKEKEAKGLLSNLGIKTPLSKIPLLNVLF